MKCRLMKYAALLMFAYAAFSPASYGQNDKAKPDSYSGVIDRHRWHRRREDHRIQFQRQRLHERR